MLSDRGGFFTDLTRTFLHALGSPNYFNHDAGCAGNIHNAALSIYGFGPGGIIFDFKNTKHLVLYGRNIVESLMVKESKGLHGSPGKWYEMHIYRSSRQHHCLQSNTITGRYARTATMHLTLQLSMRY